MSDMPSSGLVRRGAGSGGVELVVTAASIEACATVGTTAWNVFVVLALEAVVVDGVLVARSSIRDVAARLRIGKDRAAAAFARLRAAGWIELRQERVATSARFASAVYVVHAVEVVADDPRGGDERAEQVSVARSRSRMVSCETARRLFEDDEEDDDRGGWQ
jgi:hypothetical protein